MTAGRSIVVRFWVLAAAIIGFLAVAAGAIGHMRWRRIRCVPGG
jgi:hypothetical protein